MTTYGLVVEGGYDEAALTEIVKRCLSSEIEIITRRCGGKDRLMKMFPSHLKSFRYEKQGSHVNKALVIRDAHGKVLHELIEKMKNKVAEQNFPFKVKFIIIVQELEAWLLADEKVISKVTRSRSGITVARVNEDIELIPHPKEKLKETLSGAKVYYTSEVAREIAKESDLSKIESRCPRFKEFRQAVIDC